MNESPCFNTVIYEGSIFWNEIISTIFSVKVMDLVKRFVVTEEEVKSIGMCIEYVHKLIGMCIEYVHKLIGMCIEYVHKLIGMCIEYVHKFIGILHLHFEVEW